MCWGDGSAGLMLLQALFLLLIANGTPLIAASLLGSRYAWPVDGGRRAWDGARWLGRSKTYRGVVLSMLATTVAAVLFGLPWEAGLVFSIMAMSGDLLSSFIKRRLGLRSSKDAVGLDQIPESLLPLWVCRGALGLDWPHIILLVLIFWLIALLLTWLMSRYHIAKSQP